MSTVTRVPVESAVLDELGADYADRFVLSDAVVPRARSCAEQALRGAETGHGLFATVVWSSLLGLRIKPMGSPDIVAGWVVAQDDDDLLHLRSDGGRASGHMLFERTPSSLSWTTALTFHSPVARPTWRVLGPVHRSVVPVILRLLSRSVKP